MNVCVMIDPCNPWIGILVEDSNGPRVKVKDAKGTIHVINVEDCEFLSPEDLDLKEDQEKTEKTEKTKKTS